MKKKYFVVANSNAAPICSDTSKYWVEAENEKEAFEKATKEYNHPYGLYALNLYKDANAYYSDVKPIFKYLSERIKTMDEKRREKKDRPQRTIKGGEKRPH